MGKHVSLTFLGGAGTVTGSRFLIEHEGYRVLVDAGLFQGLRELRRRNWDPFPEAARLNAIVISHAHLDHVGYLPALVRQGYRGPVFATPDTIELAEIVLRDSAKLQEEDAAYASAKGFSKHAHPKALYTVEDVERALPLFVPTLFDERTDLPGAPTASIVLSRAGHILGSASVLVDIGGRRILFSGDLGRPGHPLLRPPSDPPTADVIVVESTYGNRDHPDGGLEQLAKAINRTIKRRGSVIIPAFAVDRTEVVLMGLRSLMDAGAVPHVPVFVDSPMALRALDVYRKALAGSPDVRPGLTLDDAFDPGDLRQAYTAEESKELNNPAMPSILISASGMATGGRILHHLRYMLPDARNTVVLVGYQAAGTRGRDLADGAEEIKIHGQMVPVNAEVAIVDGFSVHADADELVTWLSRSATPPNQVLVVHGEPESSDALVARIRRDLRWEAHAARQSEEVTLCTGE